MKGHKNSGDLSFLHHPQGFIRETVSRTELKLGISSIYHYVPWTEIQNQMQVKCIQSIYLIKPDKVMKYITVLPMICLPH